MRLSNSFDDIQRAEVPPRDPCYGDTVLFDGACGFCRNAMRLLRRLDTGRRLRYLSLHDPQVAERFPGLPAERLMHEMLIIDASGNRRWGVEAIRYLARRLPTLWVAAPILHFPGTLPVWRQLYRLVAANRYRISALGGCGGEACRIAANSPMKVDAN
ncbi:MAG: DUF393 domain-containing protein [Planctomycetales bacterium]|nr:DUF393 domain-containing protein [Planctomycetales bacterium]